MAKITREMMEELFPDWYVSECNYANNENGFEFSTHLPAGEEVLLDVYGETFDDMARNVERYYNDFDPEDHAAQIYHAKHYGTPDQQSFFASAPDSLEALLEDARWIDNIYYAVYSTLCKAYEEGIGDGDDD